MWEEITNECLEGYEGEGLEWVYIEKNNKNYPTAGCVDLMVQHTFGFLKYLIGFS
jgi:hypothetical protein